MINLLIVAVFLLSCLWAFSLIILCSLNDLSILYHQDPRLARWDQEDADAYFAKHNS